MKVKNYVDCVNLFDNGWKSEQLQNLKNVIIAHLPTKRIFRSVFCFDGEISR